MDRAVWTGVVVVLLAGCAKDPPPQTTEYFMDNRIALDSAMVRCSADRESTLDDPECNNARRAVARLAKIKEEEDRAKREAEFQRKRAALRAKREAEAQRRRAAEERRAQQDDAAREAAAYGVVGDGQAESGFTPGSGEPAPPPADEYAIQGGDTSGFAPPPAAAPVDPVPEEGMSQSDIQSEIEILEEELKRRRKARDGG